MATGSQPDSIFYRLYDKHVGEARTKPEVYGYWVLVLGLFAVMMAAVVYSVGQSGTLGLPSATVREIAIVLSASGTVGLVLGGVLQLPLRRRAIFVSVVGALVSLVALGVFVRSYPQTWDWRILGAGAGPGPASASASGLLQLAVVVAYAGGLVLVALVAALVPVLTGRRSLLLPEEPAENLAWVVDDETNTAPTTSVVLSGETTRDGVFAVFPGDADADSSNPRDREWRWWFVEQAAVADSACKYETKGKAQLALDDVRSKVDEASLLEVTHAAFRTYQDDDSYRWVLVDEDGDVLADGSGTYEDQQTVESDINLLKEYGPDAALLTVDDGAFELYGDGDTWDWRLVDENRGTLARGPESYEERTDAETALADVRDSLADAPLMDVEYVGFELIESSSDSEWHWQLVDADDEPIARSSHTFTDRAAAERDARRIVEGAIDMPFLEEHSPAYEIVKEGGREPGSVGDSERESENESESEREFGSDSWYWRLVDATDTVVATSQKALPSEDSGRSVVSRIKDVVADASVIELEDAEFEIFPKGDDWAWRLVTEDRETVARSPPSAAFAEPAATRDAIESVQTSVDAANCIEFESATGYLYETDEETWNWRLVDADGRVISESRQEHGSRKEAVEEMNTMRDHAPDADLVKIETETLELYEADGQWHWRLIDATGKALATSPGRHESAMAARETIETFELLAPTADMRTMDTAVFQVDISDGETRQWHWKLIHPDGNVVATSKQGFPARDDAVAAAEAVTGFAADATVHTIRDLAIRFTVTESESESEIERESGTENGNDPKNERGNGSESESQSQRESERKREETQDEWHWHIVDRNRQAVAAGIETFESRDGVASMACLVRDNAGAANIFEIDPVAIRLEESDSSWCWRLIDANRNTVAVGTDEYESRSDARADIMHMRELAADAGLTDFDRAAFELVEVDDTTGDRSRNWRSGDGWRWQFVDTDENVIGESGSTFDTKRDAQRALGKVRSLLSVASLLDIESPAFELHEDEDNAEWRWRLVDTDGSTVVESMHTYPTRREARNALDSLREFGTDAPTKITTRT